MLIINSIANNESVKGGFLMNLAFFAVLFFVILFSILLQILLKCPYAVATVVAIIALIVFAFFAETLTNIFIIWIVIYTLAALLTAFLVSRFGRRPRRENDNGNF